MGSLTLPLCMFNEPPAHCARSTHADGHRHFASAGRGGKNINRCAILSMILPERHDTFAWVGRPGKKNFSSV